MHPFSPCVAIVGRLEQTKNYEQALRYLGISYMVTLNTAAIASASHLLLPGGGDVTPAFFGQENHGSHSIDTELDLLQFQALAYFVAQKKPVLGICKGLQVINIHFGGTILQDIPTAHLHQWITQDQFHYVYHSSLSRSDFFYDLYGNSTQVNSAHHQAIDLLGRHLFAVCRAADNTIEGIQHDFLPVWGVQWHPERILESGGDLLLQSFLSLTAI